MAGRLAERMAKMSAPITTSRAGTWWFLRAAPKLDPVLLKVTRGRLSMEVGAPIMLLRTTGAKSGQPRENPLMYVTDGERIVIIASKAGSPKHPAWYHNLRANPEVGVIAKKRSGTYRARDAEGEERERLWDKARRANPGFDTYAGRTGGRQIPVVVLEPVA